MDVRLDLFNAIDKYEENMSENDALFIICYNSNDGDLMMGMAGDCNLISSVLANDNGFVNIKTKKHRLRHESAKSAVLNMAINILRTDLGLRKKFELAIQHLETVPE